KHLRERSSVTSYGDSPFGEVISLGTGGLEFVQTDVSLPGNSAIPVRIGRRFRPGNFAYSSGHFGSWHLDIPSVHGVFAFGAVGWAASDFDTSTRCSDFSAPPVQSFQGGLFAPGEYWSGTYFYVPGMGEQEVLRTSSGSPVPADSNTYPVMTTSGAVGRCIAADAGSEAFEFVTADGMVYTMDHLVAAPTSSLRKSSEMPDLFGMGGQAAMTAYQATGSPGMQPMTAVDYLLPRAEVFLFPTKIADRHGNEVSYVWSETNPWQLLRIEGDDGR